MAINQANPRVYTDHVKCFEEWNKEKLFIV